MELISVKGVSKRYTKGSETIQVLDDVSFAIQAGEMVSVIGASGAGKSTLLHVLGTLDAPDKGDILYQGKSLVGLEPAGLADFRNESLGFVFQFHHLLPEFSALENVMMPLIIRGEKEKIILKKAKQMLKNVKILNRSDHFPNQLSGGEQQRVAIARALVAETKLILADEPTGNLDYKTSEEIFSLFLKLKKLNKTIIFATHNRELANRADYKLFISDGNIKRVNAQN